MTANRALAIGGVTLIFAVAGAAIWVGTAIRGMRGDITEVKHQSETQLATLRSALTALEATSGAPGLASESELDLFADVDFKNVSDIQSREDELGPEAEIEQVAQIITEMDQWIFSADEADAATGKLDELTQKLRGLIDSKIAQLLEQARVAEDGKRAAAVMSQVNDLLSLYPVPRTAEQRLQLGQLTERILATSQRLEDIRRLRYNAWAIGEISGGLAAYQSNKRRVFNDDAALVEACRRSLREINPALLEPVALDLYNYVIGLTARAVDDAHRVKLARGFADVETERRTLADY